MSDESASIESVQPSADPVPAKARKVSTPRAKKAAKVKVVAPEEEAPAPAPVAVVEPVIASPEDSSDGDWPEPEAASSGSQAAGENPKRKRRRRKGKGQGNAAHNNHGQEEGHVVTAGPEQVSGPQPSASSHPQQAPRPPQQHQPQQQRAKVEPDQLARKAWKIFLAEVSEEGVALIGDQDAKELARRCFRLAEIFIEEQSRRRWSNQLVARRH